MSWSYCENVQCLLIHALANLVVNEVAVQKCASMYKKKEKSIKVALSHYLLLQHLDSDISNSTIS